MSLILLANFLINITYLKFFPPNDIKERIIITGDSYTQSAIYPNIFSSARNISQGAESYVISYYKLRQLLCYNHPDTIILGFSYHNFSAYNDLKFIDGRWSEEMFKRIYPLKDLNKSTFSLKYNDLQYHRVLFMNYLLFPNLRAHKNYIGDFEQSSRNDLKQLDSTIKRHYSPEGISQSSVSYLDSIILLCNQKKVCLILISTPIHEDYYHRIPEKVKTEYDKLKSLYKNQKVTILDYTNYRLKMEYYKNYDHLNTPGAIRFSHLLKNRLKSQKLNENN